MGVDCYVPISYLLQYSLAQMPKGIRSLSILRRRLSVLHTVPMFQNSGHSQENLMAFIPALEEKGASLVVLHLQWMSRVQYRSEEGAGIIYLPILIGGS